ncbi:MAG: trimethylamine methyltransferase family protein [Candidatus Aminicenantes bacterium]
MIKSIRPKLELLSKELIRKIMDEALVILERQGVFFENKQALGLFQEAGMKVDESTQRVHITPELVEDSLSSAPSVIKLYDRSGEKEFLIGEDEVHFSPGSTAVVVLDRKTNQQRKPDTQDLIQFARLTDLMENIHLQSTAVISSDVPDIISDSYRLFLGLQFCSKPVDTGLFRVQGFKPMHDMLAAIRGSGKDLARKPLAVFAACPSPPLKWSNLTAQSLIDSARSGIPSQIISMGLTGATSPVTITGTLVQHVVETLAGLVLCQLARKGAPVIFGGCPASFDMRKGTIPMGAVETMMLDSSYVQIAKFLNLPSHAYMGLSDSKIIDNQSGLETGLGAVLAALSGVNIVSGPGMLDFVRCQSLEKLLIDDQICQMVYRLVDGVSQRDDPIALHLFEKFTADTQFLSMPHTRKWYRKEHTFPRVIDRDNYDYWVSQGRKSIVDRASEEVDKLLGENPPSLLPDDIRDELTEIMLADARNNQISRLPEIKEYS